MLPVVIDSLVVGVPPSPSVIILRSLTERRATGRILPIWIGPSEAASIGMALDGSSHARPMTHDLLSTVLDKTNARLDRVVINRVEGTTFYATLVLQQDGESKDIDARPSDSIAMAVRKQVPIFVDEKVMELASFSAAGDREIEVEEFHNFIESVNPEDFKV